MTASAPTPPRLPPDIAEYLRGPTDNSRQFDFLLGRWSVSATRHGPDGVALASYRARWTAQRLDGGRMIMDDYRALSPDGADLSSYVTLRTYCERTGRWEMAGLAACQAAVPAQWHGAWRDGEMRLEATGPDPSGRTVRTRIRFHSISEQSFDWESSTSVDDGANWSLTARLHATRDQ